MAFVTKGELRGLAFAARRRQADTAGTILHEEMASTQTRDSFDVFLSHSFHDKDLILGAKRKIELQGLTVYIDWIQDKELDRSRVTTSTANRLRIRMRQSAALVYAHTENTALSKWCPWELGYFDALKQKVYIMPVAENRSSNFPDQEYVGLYPYLSDEFDELKIVHKTKARLIEEGSLDAALERFAWPSLKGAVKSI